MCFQYVDEEKAEEFKIHSFISMVSTAHHVGIPFSCMGELVENNQKIV